MNPTIIVTVIGSMALAAARVVVRSGSIEVAKSCGTSLLMFPWNGAKSILGITNADDLDERQFDLPEIQEHASAIVKKFAEAGFKVTLEFKLEPQPTEVNP
jgi:hypothetical protein